MVDFNLEKLQSPETAIPAVIQIIIGVAIIVWRKQTMYIIE